MKITLVLILTFLLTSCGIAAKINARNDMTQSKEAYKRCLSQHANDVTACNASKLAYEADLQDFRATSSGVRNGNVTEVEVNNQQ
jgi:hypothetical protein